jgi:hypothetical protein
MTVKLRVARSETHDSVQAKFIFFFLRVLVVSLGGMELNGRYCPSG